MPPRDWLLLFVALDSVPERLDPVRVQKGLFLLAQEGELPRRERYGFVAYNYGPMSPDVYRDVEILVRRRLLERHLVAGQRWSEIGATRVGRDRARQFVEQADRREQAVIERLREIRRFVCAVDFGRLLATIYDRYPAFAERSVFRRP